MCCDGSRPTLRLGRQDSQRRQHPARALAVYLHAEPVRRLLAPRRPDVFGHHPLLATTARGGGHVPIGLPPAVGKGRVPSPHGSVPGDRPAAESAGFAASCRMPRATSSTGLPHYPPAASADPFRPDTTRGQPHPQPRACVRRTGQAQVDTVWSRDQRPCRHGNPHPPRSA